MVSVIQVAFQEGYIMEALMWKTMFLISNGRREYRLIGLVETIFKVYTSISDSRIRSSIVFQDVLHGFRQGRGTGTAIMEAKL